MCVSLKSFVKKVGAKSPVKKRLGSWRKKIWNLDHRFHCAVAGTCFTLLEMRQFCCKAQVSTRGSVSDYELYTRIKRDCKRYGKFLMLLSQSSLSAFAKGVHEYSRVSSMAH